MQLRLGAGCPLQSGFEKVSSGDLTRSESRTGIGNRELVETHSVSNAGGTTK